VSTYCLGTMMFGQIGNPDHDECARILHAALDAGINFVDTADMYSDGEAEEIVGRALKGRRDDVVLATKVHFPMGEGPNRGGNSRRWIQYEVDESLRRLQTEWIDLYQVHRPDYSTDIDETLDALTDLVRAGKIRYFGCSTFPAEQIVEAYHVARQRELLAFRTEQPPYSLVARGIETAVLPTCQRLGMGVLTWSPLGWGLLTGRHRAGAAVTDGRAALAPGRFDPARPENKAKFDAVEQLAGLAAELDVPLPHLAIAFPTVHPAVTSVIIGPRTMDQLNDLLVAGSLTLTDEVMDKIDEIVPPGTDTYDTNSLRKQPWLTDASLRRRAAGERAAVPA
jgi:aryl-alcohol dehydrogenase-like predicted oxidoreductase